MTNIHHISYFPPIHFFRQIKEESEVHIEACETYQKRSTRNKTTILGPQGSLVLSVPLVKGKHNQQSIKEVAIAYQEDWIKEHLKKMEMSYIKSAFYIHYIPEIKLLLQQEFRLLFDLDMALLQWSLQKLKWQKEIKLTDHYNGVKPNPLTHGKHYPQVYDYKYGFTDQLSIIDLLMNVGPEANYYL